MKPGAPSVEWDVVLIGAVFRAAERLDVSPEDVALALVVQLRTSVSIPSDAAWVLRQANQWRAAHGVEKQ